MPQPRSLPRRTGIITLVAGLSLFVGLFPAQAEETVKRDIEDTVRAGLDWLVRHQNSDGSWSHDRWSSHCNTDGPCSCRSPKQASPDGTSGIGSNDVATTALCLRAFMAGGHTHRDGENQKYRQAVRRGIEWLLTKQIDNEAEPSRHGMFAVSHEEGELPSDATLSHALALHALGVQLMISRDKKWLLEPVTRATEWSIRAQSKKGGWGSWPESDQRAILDLSQHLLALSMARACSLTRVITTDREDIKRCIGQSLEWLQSRASSREDDAHETPLELAAIAVAEGIAKGWRESYETSRRRLEPLLPHWRASAAKEEPGSDPLFWYLSGHFHFQVSQDRWGKHQAEELIVHQRVQGCSDGSWDPIGESIFDHSRTTVTALALLTLECPLRSRADWTSVPLLLKEKKSKSN